MTAALSATKVDDFRRDGFLVGLDVFTEREALLAAVDVLSLATTGLPRPVDHDQVVPWNQKTHLLLPSLDALLVDPRLTDPVAAILGDDVLALSADVFVKHPHSPGRITWHQDVNYWDLRPWDMFTAWVALTPAFDANGCMHYAPGGHQGRIEHVERPSHDNLLSRGQELAVAVDETTTRAVELRPGQVSFHHALAPHASGPNLTDSTRIGFAIRYAAAGVRQHGGTPISARLVRGRDHGTFTLEEPPSGRLSQQALATHRAALLPHAADNFSTV